MTTGRRTVLLALAAFPLAACSSGSSKDSQASPATGASGNGAKVEVDAFKKQMAKEGARILDVRTPDEFASGHLEKAENIDVNAADFASRMGALDKSLPWAVYCHSGNRSGIAVEAMVAAGFTDVVHLDGGIGGWEQAGNPVVKD